MKLLFPPFNTFIKNNTTASSRSRYQDSEIRRFELSENEIRAEVLGTFFYEVRVRFNKKEVLEAQCTCPYDYEGACKHIIHTLVYADKNMQEEQNSAPKEPKEKTPPEVPLEIKKSKSGFVIKKRKIQDLTLPEIEKMGSRPNRLVRQYSVAGAKMPADAFIAQIFNHDRKDHKVAIQQKDEELLLSCSCDDSGSAICPHIQHILVELHNLKGLQISFDKEKRYEAFSQQAKELGIATSENLDDYFELHYDYYQLSIVLKKNILSLSKDDIKSISELVIPEFELPGTTDKTRTTQFILAENSHDAGFNFYLMRAPLAKNGNIKSPIREANLQETFKSLKTKDEFLFITALAQQDKYDPGSVATLPVLKNPLQLPFYYYETHHWKDEKITPHKINPVHFHIGKIEVAINIRQKEKLYELSLAIQLDGKKRKPKNLSIIGDFICDEEDYFYFKNKNLYRIVMFFREHGYTLSLTPGQFPIFKKQILDPVEEVAEVHYNFIRKAPKTLIRKNKLDQITEHLIYLSESNDYILITPVMRYGEIEAPILSKRNIYAQNDKGKLYTVKRHPRAEFLFKQNIQKLHPDFEEEPLGAYYYLHKQEFLDEGWFIDAFEEWRKHNYSILGFKQLKNNNLNPYKMSVSTRVSSGIDWFDIHADVQFGDQKVGLKEIRKSVRNKTRYVKLGDGTRGILPEEWIDRFSQYFRSGEIKGDLIRTHKSQFGLIDELFEQEVLDREVKIEVERYQEKLANFHSIRHVNVPKKLKATLRDYQKEGLNWLHFLDEFGFGGCLADDMGLGKTVQILAYFLSQLEKGRSRPNLVIVPTSLLFNWEVEIQKFAPTLTYRMAYGINRDTENIPFADYNVILTSYGTMLNDIEILRKVEFNCIVLDESQAIKNPNSKRYKAVRLLQGRQRIVATGTPVENNTFDLYAQLSFAIPGLLGSAKQFADAYSTPIDKFSNEKRAEELQKKVRPFILRRTKKQVATELPQKTEMVIHCTMGKEQRQVYDTYKKEFQQFLKGKDEDELKSSSMHILQGLTKMRQICNSPALLSDEEYYGNQSAKLDELMVQVKKLQGEHKILVFSQFVTMLELIKDRLEKEDIGFTYLTGKTRKRQEKVDAFQEDDEVRVFLISLKAGGTGLNLTKAEYVFIVDPWWNPAVENQAIDRAYRIGQTNKVVAIRLITPDTIEEKILELQDRKKQLAEDLIHTDSGFFKQLKKEDLMEMV